ncbi:MAG: hypothetical protein IPI66_11245 [Chitinophagaceae bacterium]|nr:hypothetical protein [Chitinophagaceae bacterium]
MNHQVKKNTLKLLCFAISLMGTTLSVRAQTPRTPPKPKVQQFKPPKLFTQLSIRMDSVVVDRAEAVLLIKMPLLITDEKKNVYKISSYQFMYKKLGVTEDEASGKVSPTSSRVINLFKTTPLPELWLRIITEDLKSGEELYFYDVIVKDAAGRLMFAPSLKIKVK